MTNRAAANSTTALYDALTTALASMPVLRTNGASDELPAGGNVLEPPIFISKWMDYSNKYGFGVQLSDRSIGVLFNDDTRISYSPDRRCIYIIHTPYTKDNTILVYRLVVYLSISALTFDDLNFYVASTIDTNKFVCYSMNGVGLLPYKIPY